MPNLVVDSSVAVKWFIVEPHSAEARRILDDYQNGALSFLAPDLIYAEFGNVIWKKHLFQGLAAVDAQNIITTFRALRFTITPAEFLLENAYNVAVMHRQTVYDSLYLALSLRENCQLVTADEMFVKAVGATFPNLVGLANWL
jgi:predicted nucleic acid-binding protein